MENRDEIQTTKTTQGCSQPAETPRRRYVRPEIITHSAESLDAGAGRISACTSFNDFEPF